MERQIIELYSDGDLARLERRVKAWRLALWILALAALVTCVTLIRLTTTGNAAGMERAVIVTSTLAGWVVIYGKVFIVTAGRRELGHARMLREEERQRVEGPVTVTAERIVIRSSITARRVEVPAGESRRLLVCEGRANALAAAEASAVYTTHGYVAAYEVRA